MIDLQTIDFSQDTRRIYRFHGRKYQKAVNRLIKRRGARCNQAGVFDEQEEVLLARVGKCIASASLAQTPEGIWFAGMDYMTPTQGGGYAPSARDREAYPTRRDAIAAMALDARDRFEGIVSRVTDSCISEATRREAAEMVKALDALIEPAEPDLFAALA
jgi:hypothetical protein